MKGAFYFCCVYYLLMRSWLLSLTFDIALSHWCIFNRSNAEQVVSTWKKQFDKSDVVHRIPLLYLANDIMQNSKRNGNEFVIEFWKVLPAALKDVIATNDDRGKREVSRLVSLFHSVCKYSKASSECICLCQIPINGKVGWERI